ncbi:TonB-dependent receptor [Lacibacter luteus]|uniref:TonB-dependent receptor n=2 Tax=Lacibacter luteus TaxID=2508719 RepID=A0A4Q1CPF4_9BACT|nr:TonB-dependent receptor [Lacibacter luteus]
MHFVMRNFCALLLLLLFAATAEKSYAQGTKTIIAGTIKDEQQKGIPGATVKVKNESTGFSAMAVTNTNGEYVFNELPLGGPYSVFASAVGYGEQKQVDYTLNLADQLQINFLLMPTVNQLQEVQVVANTLKRSIKTLGASTAVTSKELTKLPVNGRNFTSLIDLSPVSNGSTLAGQLASSTNYTIDGMTARSTIAGGNSGGAYSISMEVIREFKVVTNEYDVTNGRSGGGSITTVTKSGTNTLSGSAFTFGRTNWLSSNYNLNGSRRNQEFSTYQYGFSLGGPIIKDKAHFFVAWDHQADSRPLYIADIQTPADIVRYKVTQATLDKFSQVAHDKYGTSSNPQFGAFGKKKQTDAAFARIDWQLNRANLLTIRNNFIYDMDNQADGDNSGINMYEVYADRRNLNNSFMASLRTVVGKAVTNELKLQHFYESSQVIPNSELPAQSIPRAIVENVESIDGTNKYYNSIQLGGQRYTPEWFKGNVLQLVNNVYYNTRRYKFTLGADIMFTNMAFRYGSEMNGRFYFTGMSNFENLTPYRYARDVYMTDEESTSTDNIATGVYGQVETTLFEGFDMIAGVRADNTKYIKKANFNKVVYDSLGIKTDNGINTFQIQPRVQFTWDIAKQGKNILKFGAGIFGSNLNPYSMINNILFDGSHIAGVDITNTALIPVPNFPGYRANPASAPGKDLFNNPQIEKLVTINTNSPDIKVPTVYKANFSFNHFFTSRLRVGVSAYGTWARNNYMYIDRNMVDKPYFTIASEQNRGVYVPASTIRTSNGTSNWVNSRKTTAVGRVLELVSTGKVNSYTVVADATYRYFKDGQINMSYTWNDTKDNTSYNGNVANTATLALMVKDDPRDLSGMAYSDNQFRYKFVFYATAPSIWGISLGVRYSGIGGTRYTLAVSGNMNGDFVSSNDLPFVYDPSNTSTPDYLRTGIQAILNNPNAEQSIKDYIKRDLGKIATRNGGVNGFYGVFDVRLAKSFRLYKTHRLEASADIFNFANMLNKKWGVGHNLGKQNLYSIRNFNAAEQIFNYNVNTAAGVSNLNGNPFQVQLGLRYSF